MAGTDVAGITMAGTGVVGDVVGATLVVAHDLAHGSRFASFHGRGRRGKGNHKGCPYRRPVWAAPAILKAVMLSS